MMVRRNIKSREAKRAFPVVPETLPETAIGISKTKEIQLGYSKTDVNRMPVAQLRELCRGIGVECEEMSGAKMKQLLIDKMGL